MVAHSPTAGVSAATSDYVLTSYLRDAERVVFVAGTMGLDPAGAPGTTLTQQLDLIWSNLRRAQRVAEAALTTLQARR